MNFQSKASTDSIVETSKPRLLGVLGPGLISGASDDDPTAIATYSQAGAKFGYGLCWLMPLVFPLMVVVQQVSARIGRTTGNGLAGNIRRHYPPWLLNAAVGLLLIANTIQLSADLGIMGDALAMLIGGPRLLYVVLFGILCVGLQVFMRYTRYVSILKWTTLSLLAYVATVLLADVSWGDVAAGMIPAFSLDSDRITMVVAIFGAAISPFLFFWQSSQEAEDQRVKPEREPLIHAPHQAPHAIERIRLDTYVGMAVATFVGLSIMITAAATLNAGGITEIRTSAEAAEALRPAAGPMAMAVFSLGIIGTGLLAVPVLAGSAAYAIGEARHWPVGLSRGPLEAKAFYGTVSLATLIGIGINFSGIDPMQALFWSAVINGVVAVPVMAVMMLMASKPEVMGEHTIPASLRIVGWIAVAIMVLSVIAMAVASLS
jgi:NRAMP (natural resistance-associated macrophage protein)-like metal ion transporter